MSNNHACAGYIYPLCALLKVVSRSSHSSSDNRLNKCGSSMSSMLAASHVINHPG